MKPLPQRLSRQPSLPPPPGSLPSDADDSLFGEAGNDNLAGGGGNDLLHGGPGNDSFVFSETGAANQDTIEDFSHADDTLVLTDLLDSVTDGKIKGLAFDGSNVLRASSYFEGESTGSGRTDPSGIYVHTPSGSIWYNPTSDVFDDSVRICTVGVATAPTLDHTDFVYTP